MLFNTWRKGYRVFIVVVHIKILWIIIVSNTIGKIIINIMLQFLKNYCKNKKTNVNNLSYSIYVTYNKMTGDVECAVHEWITYGS